MQSQAPWPAGSNPDIDTQVSDKSKDHGEENDGGDIDADGAPGPKAANADSGRKAGRSLISRLARFCLKLALVGVILLVVLAAVAWFSRGWLLEKSESILADKLAEKEIYLSYESADYQPLRGLLLSDITLWQDVERTVPQIKLGNVAFRPGLGKLIKGRVVEGDLSIVDGELDLFADGQSVLEIDALQLDAGVAPGGVTVNNLEGSTFGIDFSIDGFAALGSEKKDKDASDDGEDEKGDRSKEKKPLDLSFLAPLGEWLVFQSQGERPRLNVHFNVDRKAEDPVVVEASFEGESFSWRELPLERLGLDVDYSDAAKTVHVGAIGLRHRGGDLEGEITYGLTDGKVSINGLVSTLNLIALARDLPFDLEQHLARVNFQTEHPSLRVDGVLQLKDFPASMLSLEMADPFSVTLNLDPQTRVPLADLHGLVAFGDGMLGVQDLGVSLYGVDLRASGKVVLGKKGSPKSEVGREPVAAAADDDDDVAEANVASEADESADSKPKKDVFKMLAGVFSQIEKWTSFTSTGANPVLDVDFAVDRSAADPVVAKGNLSGKNFSWQGAALDSLDIDFGWSQSAMAIDLPRLEIIYQGKPIRGGVNYSLPSRKLQLSQLHCEADWVSLATDLPFGLEKTMSMFELPEPPLLLMDGTVDIGNIFASSFTVDSPRSVPVTLNIGERRIELRGFRGNVRLEDRSIHSKDMEILLGSGTITWNGAFAPSTKAVDGSLVVSDVPLAELLKLAGKEPMAGVLNAQITAVGDAEVLMRSGQGQIRITEAEALKIPVVGGLLSVLAKIAPVFGTTTDGEVSVSFVTEKGVMKTDDLIAKGSGFEVEGKGWVNWNDKSTEFQATANFDGVMKLITLVASKALEIEGKGPLNDIQWSLKNLDPTKLTDNLKGLFGVGGEFLGGGAEGLSDGVRAVGEGAVEGVEKVGKGVMKIGEGAVEGAGKVGEGVAKVGEGAVEGVGKVGEGVMKIGEGAGEGVKKIGEGATEGAKKVREGLRGLIPGMGKKDEEKKSSTPDPTPAPAPPPQ